MYAILQMNEHTETLPTLILYSQPIFTEHLLGVKN